MRATVAPDITGVRPVRRCSRCERPGSGAQSDVTPIDGPVATRKRQEAWMQSLGHHVRRTRELLGLTQGQLATIAGTSQAAVSRLELGGALGTPYLVVLAVQSALCSKLRELSGTFPASDAEHCFDHPSMMAELTDARPVPPVVVAEELLRYVAIFNEAPPPLRAQLLTIVEAVVAPARPSSP